VVTDRRPPERPVSPYLRAATLILALLPVMIIRPAETPAEVRTTVRIDATNSLIFGAAEPLSAGLATAELDLEALGNRDVRSRFQLRSTLLENAPAATASNPTAATVITVPRAEIRWRMDAGASTVRFTVGRTRLTWGDGQLYNAGDVINGVRPSNTDLTATTLRDETQWLTVAYLPLGRFSFLEAVALFPMSRVGGVDETGGDDPDIATPTLAGSIAPSRAAETAGGGRIQGQIGASRARLATSTAAPKRHTSPMRLSRATFSWTGTPPSPGREEPRTPPALRPPEDCSTPSTAIASAPSPLGQRPSGLRSGKPSGSSPS
jgi:hypothetical protein